VNTSQYKIAKELPSKVKLFVYGKDLRRAVVELGGMATGTYGPMLGAMVRLGLVRAKKHEKNRREKIYSITVEGKKAITKYEKAMVA